MMLSTASAAREPWSTASSARKQCWFPRFPPPNEGLSAAGTRGEGLLEALERDDMRPLWAEVFDEKPLFLVHPARDRPLQAHMRPLPARPSACTRVPVQHKRYPPS
jgi:hypothetical protein